MSDLHGDLDALVTEVHRRVEQRALERSAMAERRAHEVLEQADAEAGRTLAERKQRTTVEIEALRARSRARARMDGERTTLGAREAVLDRVWEGARLALEALTAEPERYAAALRRLARLTARTLATDEVTLASDRRGRALLTSARLELWGREDGVRYRLDPEPAPGPGLIARAGRLVCDATFATRQQQAREALRDDLAQDLFSGGAA